MPAASPVPKFRNAMVPAMPSAPPNTVAAPTAGLHFTPELIEGMKARGFGFEEVTLHVGAGTFLPVKDDDAARHPMHTEHFEVRRAAVARLLGTNQIDPHAASLSGQRQLSAATRARDAVAGALDAAQGLGLDAVSVCVDDALDALCELTGENASEAVINEVFERFCVGK